MKKSIFYSLFIFLSLISFSCSLTTEEDKGSVSIVLPSMNESRSVNNFYQMPKSYEITIGLENEKGYIYNKTHTIEDSPIVIKDLRLGTYVITVTGHTDVSVWSGKETKQIKSGENKVNITLVQSAKEILGYYVDSNVKENGNGTKTYPFNSISYALDNIYTSKPSVTLFLNGEFTEKIVIDEKSRIQNLKLKKMDDALNPPVINAKNSEREPIFYDSIVILNSDKGSIESDGINYKIGGETYGDDQGTNAVINVVKGQFTLKNSLIDVPIVKREGQTESENYPACPAINIFDKGNFYIGGNIDILNNSIIGLMSGGQEITTYTVINLISNVKTKSPLQIELNGMIETTPIPLIKGSNNCKVEDNINNFVYNNYDYDDFFYELNNKGELIKTKASLNYMVDENISSLAIYTDGKEYTVNKNINPGAASSIQDSNSRYLYLDIDKPYEIEVSVTKNDGTVDKQLHRITLKKDDYITKDRTLYINTNKDFYVSDMDTSCDTATGLKSSPYASLSGAFNNIREKVTTSSRIDRSENIFNIHVDFTKVDTPPLMQLSSMMIVDYPATINVIPENINTTPIINNVHTQLLEINHSKANVIFSNMTLQCGEQTIQNEGFINLKQGRLELVNTEINSTPTLNETWGIKAQKGTNLVLTGKVMEDGQNRYEKKIDHHFIIEKDATITINFAVGLTPNFSVIVPNDFDITKPLFKTPTLPTSLTGDQMYAFSVKSMDLSKVYDINNDGTLYQKQNDMPPIM